MFVNVYGLDCGDGSKESFLQHNAVWHKSCYLKFNNLKLDRAQKRKEILGSNPLSKKTRKSVDATYNVESWSCVHPLSSVHTKSCSQAIVECATILGDTKMLAKVAERPDLMTLEGKYHNKCLTDLKNWR